ncbi:hypothetical protein BASA81_005867 [Batrachochytrium salamandrivorans]|nr:hypothetical protein BASA81_005867 [Batrachochytrium salamandrivorans]
MKSSLLDRMAMLMSKKEGERKETLKELFKALDSSDPQNNKTRSRTVLDSKVAVDVLFNLSSTTSSADVAGDALRVLLRLARDDDNAKRLFQEHPSLVLVAMRKLEFEAENATEGVQINALALLYSLADVDNQREMVTKNPTLVPLLMANVESKSEQIQVRALFVLQNLAIDVDNQREMVTKNPTLVPLLVAKMESNSDPVQVSALFVLHNLAIDVDNQREMVTKNPTLVPLLLVKVEFKWEHVQMSALSVLLHLVMGVDNQREMVTKNPTLVSLLIAKVESNSEQVQEVALGVLQELAFDVDNRRDMAIKNPTLVPLLVAKMESNSEEVQIKALSVLYNLAVNVVNKREMITKNPTIIPLLVAKVESNSEQVQERALKVLDNLAINVDNAAEMMAACSAVLLPLLVEKMNGNTPLEAITAVYRLSCSPANQSILRGNNSVVAALTKGREDEYTSFFSLLAHANLFGAEENSKQAIDDKNALAVEYAMSTLAQFSSDPEPLAWMRSNKPRLDEVINQLAPFPDALKTAQLLQLTLDQEVAATVAPPVATVPKQPAPQGEKEIRQWLSKHKRGEEIADNLVKKDLVEAEDLENLSNLTPAELKILIGFDAKQALTLGAALKEFF